METNEAGCEFQLLAKDGVFITDYPRAITGAIPVPPGGRADFMVRCSNVGIAKFSALARDTLTVTSQKNGIALVAVRDSSTGVSQNDTAVADAQVLGLTAWAPPSYPDYLQSVMQVPPTDGCTCPFKLAGYDDTSRING